MTNEQIWDKIGNEEFLLENVSLVKDYLKEQDQKTIKTAFEKILYKKEVVKAYADFYTTNFKDLHKQEKFLIHYGSNKEVANLYADAYVEYMCFAKSTDVSALYAALLIDDIEEKLMEAFKKAPKSKKGEVLGYLAVNVPTEKMLDLVNKELKKADGEYKLNLLFLKKMLENCVPLEFDIPAMPPVPKQEPITPEEAKKIALRDIAGFRDKYKNLDLEECILLFNNIKMTEREKEIVEIRNKIDDDNEIFFSVTGPYVYRTVKLLETFRQKMPAHLFVNYSLRSSYMNGDTLEIRTLDFDDNIDPDFKDLRQLYEIMKEQDLIPNLDTGSVVARSIHKDRLFEIAEPEAIWTFFAENPVYMDRAMGLYGRVSTLATIPALKVIGMYPVVPQRYLYPLIQALEYGKEYAMEAYKILRKLPNLKEILEETKEIAPKKLRKAIEEWLEEVDFKNEMPKRYFVHAGESKFWNIEQKGNVYEVEFGKVGAKKPKTAEKEFDTKKKCLKAIESIISQKLSKGYVEENP